MSIRNLPLSVALAAAAALSFDSSARAEPASVSCLPASFNATHVASLYSRPIAERTETAWLVGAQFFVPAMPGLTSEWIRASLTGRSAAVQTSQAAQQCPEATPGVRLSVVSGTTGFWIQIAGSDPQSANEIVRRARRISQ